MPSNWLRSPALPQTENPVMAARISYKINSNSFLVCFSFGLFIILMDYRTVWVWAAFRVTTLVVDAGGTSSATAVLRTTRFTGSIVAVFTRFTFSIAGAASWLTWTSCADFWGLKGRIIITPILYRIRIKIFTNTGLKILKCAHNSYMCIKTATKKFIF